MKSHGTRVLLFALLAVFTSYAQTVRYVFAHAGSTKTNVAGSAVSKPTSRAPGNDAFLRGLTFDETGDKPCFVMAHWWRFHTEKVREDFTTTFDICGGNASGDQPVVFNSDDVKLPAVDSVQICQSSDNNPRLKGATLTAAAIDRNSSDAVESKFLTRTFERPNCSKWSKTQSCPAGAVATGIDIHHNGKEITGLALSCTVPTIGSAKYEPPPPLSNDQLWDRFSQDIRVQVDENGRTKPLAIKDAVTRHEVNGLSIVIIKAGKIERVRHFGVRSRKTNAPTNDDTIYDTASLSKLPASVAMLAAARATAGPRLERTARDTAKEFPDSMLAKWVNKQFKSEVESGFPDDITVERLISHSAGLDTHSVGTAGGDNPTSMDTILLGGIGNPGVEPLAAPGTVWEYSGGGFTAAEAMLEAHTGKSARSFLNTNVLEAFGMTKSTYADASDSMNNLARGCSRGTCGDKPEHTEVKFAGGLLAHPEEYAKLLLVLMNGGRDPNNAASQLIPSDDLNRLLTPISHRDSSRKECSVHADCRSSERCYGAKCIRPLGADGSWYGYGVSLGTDSDYRGLPRFVGHTGAHTNAHCQFTLDRDTRDGMVVFIAGETSWNKSGVTYGASALLDDIIEAYGRNYR